MKYIAQLLLCFLVGTSTFVFAQIPIHTFRIYPSSTTTYKQGIPILYLNSSNKLTLSFDILNEERYNFYYRLVHCDASLQPDNMQPIQYIEGQHPMNISNKSTSFTTQVFYQHYEASIPEEFVTLKLSGNYLLEVYEEENPEIVLGKEYFYVVENKAEINASVISWNMGDTPTQQVQVNASFAGYKVNNPNQDIYLAILKNHEYYQRRLIQHPSFVNGTQVSYTNVKDLEMEAGNEYRFFDIRYLKFSGEYVAKIIAPTNKEQAYKAVLQPIIENYTRLYQTNNTDNNGSYVIQNLDRRNNINSDTEADYVATTIQLDRPYPYPDANLYVINALYKNTNDTTLLKYDIVKQCYTKTILFKQGRYEYKIIAVDKEGVCTEKFTEGNHAQTDNQYTLFLYHHDFLQSYDRLIGIHTVYSP